MGGRGGGHATWAAMDELLGRDGCPDRRVVWRGGRPGGPGPLGRRSHWRWGARAPVSGVMEALPLNRRRGVDAARFSEYKYARCATLPGARCAGSMTRRSRSPERGAAAILHPAHLDGAPATLTLDEVVPLARAAGVAVVVDAAFLSFPLTELERWSNAADVACFSAKYFCGTQRRWFHRRAASHYVADIAALDFTGYESGRGGPSAGPSSSTARPSSPPGGARGMAGARP